VKTTARPPTRCRSATPSPACGLLAALDWSAFFESVSLVERELRGEPTGVYARQTFATRDTYRAAVERFARGSGTDEVAVARLAIEAAADGAGPHEKHLGHYLVGDGRRRFGKRIGYRPRWGDALRGEMKRRPAATYFGLLALFTGLAVAAAVALAWPGAWPLALSLALLAVLPASEVGVALGELRRLPGAAAARAAAHGLPRGHPGGVRHVRRRPGMLTKPQSARTLLDRLELHYLANSDPNLHFALLTGLRRRPCGDDGGRRRVPEGGDGGRAGAQREARPDGPRASSVVATAAPYNASEGLLDGLGAEARASCTSSTASSAARPTHVRPLLAARPRCRARRSADAGQRHRAAARRRRVLIGTLAHPLNSPVIGQGGRRVVAGYSILQPRVSFLYRAGWQSLFARLFAYSGRHRPVLVGRVGHLPGSRRPGQLTGKGCTTWTPSRRPLAAPSRQPHILSHDLIECNFARCALVSDVEGSTTSRPLHRLLAPEHRGRAATGSSAWLMPRVPTAHDGRQPTRCRDRALEGRR